MIKKILGLGIVVLGFVGSTFGKTQEIGLNSSPSSANSSFEITALTKGNVITNVAGISKGILAFSNSRLFFRTNTGIPYVYYSNSKQGYTKYYFLCDKNSSDTPVNCTSYSFEGDGINVVSTLLSTVSAGDIFYYANINEISSDTRICWYSSFYSQYLCFIPNYLQNSLGYSGLTFNTITSSMYVNSPGTPYNGDESGIPEGEISYVCPTVGQLLSYYDSSLYNTGICYSPSIIYTGGSFQTVTPSSIFELFTDLNDYKQYLQLYGTYCNSVSTMCEQVFSGKELQYLYIANLNSSLRSSEKQVYQYCNLALNYDPNASSCVGSGVIQPGDQVSNKDIVQSISDGYHVVLNPVTNLSGGDTTVYNMFSNQFKSEYTGDVLDTVNSIYVKFTSLFKQQISGGDGILPSYIIVVLLGIILFKLFKK